MLKIVLLGGRPVEARLTKCRAISVQQTMLKRFSALLSLLTSFCLFVSIGIWQGRETEGRAAMIYCLCLTLIHLFIRASTDLTS